jgi:hypothetical protein
MIIARLAEPYKNKENTATRVRRTFSTTTTQAYGSLEVIYYYKLPKNPCLAEIKGYAIAIQNMVEHKSQYPFSKEHEEKVLLEIGSEQDIQIEVSNAQAPRDQVNAIEPTIKRNNYRNPSTINTDATPNNNFSLTRDEETDITIAVRNAGDVLYDSILLSVDKTKRKSIEKAKEVATRDLNPAAIAAKKDAQDIATLGESVESIARRFEILMTEISKKSYSEQVRLLTGYKKLLKEQINVIDSRINMTGSIK